MSSSQYQSCSNGNNEQWIELVLIITIEQNIDIGISFKFDSMQNINIGDLSVGGIHLERDAILDQHQLLCPRAQDQCLEWLDALDSFNSQINDLRIGNPDDNQNRIKDLQARCEKYEGFMRAFVNTQLGDPTLLHAQNVLQSSPTSAASCIMVNSSLPTNAYQPRSSSSSSPHAQNHSISAPNPKKCPNGTDSDDDKYPNGCNQQQGASQSSPNRASRISPTRSNLNNNNNDDDDDDDDKDDNNNNSGPGIISSYYECGECVKRDAMLRDQAHLIVKMNETIQALQAQNKHVQITTNTSNATSFNLPLQPAAPPPPRLPAQISSFVIHDSANKL